jgi:hypothetical protein
MFFNKKSAQFNSTSKIRKYESIDIPAVTH